MEKILRSIAAVIAGFVTIVVLAIGVNAVVQRFQPAFTTGGDNARPWILAFILLCMAIFWALGGYVTASLSKRSPLKHVIGLGLLQLLVGISSVTLAGDALPRWYAATLVIFPIPVIYLGGYLRARSRT